MTRTLAADAVMSACDRSASGCPAPAVRSGRLRSARPPLIPQRTPVPQPCQPMPEHRLYLYLFQWHAATLFGCSFDPGRDVLCILTSPRRWLRWP
jgi:hypothetical protein